MTVPSAQTLLVYIGGVITTVAGSWISSKIRVYHDNIKAHRDEIKQAVLVPLYGVLSGEYASLVCHRSPVVVQDWGARLRREGVSVTERQNEDGPKLNTVAPGTGSTDQALYTDAKQRHFRKLIVHTEQFLSGWHNHAGNCKAWVENMSEEILTESRLPSFQASSDSYVMHYRLAVFIYRRLFNSWEFPLSKSSQGSRWVLDGFEGASVAGTQQQVDAVLALLDRLQEREKDNAARLLRDARILEHDLDSLCSELNYAIAARHLHKRCDFVPFF